MRKLALLAVVLMPLVSGCISHTCDVPTVTIDWTLRDSGGFAWTCNQAGVVYVDVYIGNNFQLLNLPCNNNGAVIDVSGIPPGTYATTVEGLGLGPDGVTYVIYDRALFNVTVGDCGGNQNLAVLAEGTLEIDYHFTAPDQCHGGSMWFALRDDTTGQDIYVVDGITMPASWRDHYACYACDPIVPTLCVGTPLNVPVPYGPYTLRGIQEVVNPLTSPLSVYEMCTPSSFSINAPGTTFFTPPLLQPTSPTAPPCF